MEVHHHPKIEKKNFKEYFLEFLMIFLAVTLGFLAENIREYISDHHKAHTFAVSMKEDLKADTAQLNSYNKYFKVTANYIDTFMVLLQNNDAQNISSGKLYWYGLWGGARGSFISNDATFEQMKSSGSLGLFKSKTTIDIEKYDRLCRLLEASDDMTKDIYTEVRKARAMIFDFKYNEIANKITQANRVAFNQARIDSFIATDPPLLSHDKVLFKQANIVLSDLNKDYH
jgi:hypothetical protein